MPHGVAGERCDLFGAARAFVDGAKASRPSHCSHSVSKTSAAGALGSVPGRMRRISSTKWRARRASRPNDSSRAARSRISAKGGRSSAVRASRVGPFDLRCDLERRVRIGSRVGGGEKPALPSACAGALSRRHARVRRFQNAIVGDGEVAPGPRMRPAATRAFAARTVSLEVGVGQLRPEQRRAAPPGWRSAEGNCAGGAAGRRCARASARRSRIDVRGDDRSRSIPGDPRRNGEPLRRASAAAAGRCRRGFRAASRWICGRKLADLLRRALQDSSATSSFVSRSDIGSSFSSPAKADELRAMPRLSRTALRSTAFRAEARDEEDVRRRGVAQLAEGDVEAFLHRRHCRSSRKSSKGVSAVAKAANVSGEDAGDRACARWAGTSATGCVMAGRIVAREPAPRGRVRIRPPRRAVPARLRAAALRRPSDAPAPASAPVRSVRRRCLGQFHALTGGADDAAAARSASRARRSVDLPAPASPETNAIPRRDDARKSA